LFCGQVLENDGADENLTLIISKKGCGVARIMLHFRRGVSMFCGLWQQEILNQRMQIRGAQKQTEHSQLK